MNELFGLSMTIIMLVLLALLALCAATVAWVLLQNRVMFFIGVRNIPRRRAQTVLIIIGLMLSTLIIATAFSIGDTVDYSITNTSYERLHSVDELVLTKAESDEGAFGDSASLISALSVPQADADAYVAAIRRTDGVDGAISIVRGAAAAQNEAKGQTEPTVVLFGIDPAQLAGFVSDVETLDGRQVSPADLDSGEIYANKSAAEKLDIAKGDQIKLFVSNKEHAFTVKEIVKDRVLTGAVFGRPEGFLVSLSRAQELFGRPGEVDTIAVSNAGGVRDGLEGSKEVTTRLNTTVFLGQKVAATPTKRDFVDQAAETSSIFTTFFIVLGLFSIAAGLLLIFLIFVMLAAERKMEMGMMRAVGTKRRHLVQIFMSEGMVYNVGAAAVGCGLGIGVAVVMIRVMQMIFAGLDLQIIFHVTLRSLIVSYSVGVVLTFLTVTFSSWRIGNINIVSAIRDTAEPLAMRDRPARGGLLGTIFRNIYWIVFKPATKGEWLRVAALVGVIAVEAVLAFALGSLATWLLVIGIVVITLTALVLAFQIFQAGAMLLTVGGALAITGLASGQAGPFGLGFSAVVFGAAIVLAQLRFPARPVYTTAGLLLLVAWLLLAGGNTPIGYINDLDGDIEMFFISGVSMVLASTFVLVYNTDRLLGVLTLAGAAFPSLVPAIRTAIAYPLSNKFRTGMTIAMISLVMFALVMMSTMNSNFDRIFLSDKALGGYEVVATENAGNPIGDLKEDLAIQGFDVSDIARVDKIDEANTSVSDVKQLLVSGETTSYDSYAVHGLGAGFIANNGLNFQARANGFDSDAAVWQAMAQNPDYAVIDAFAMPSGGFGDGGGGFTLTGIKATDRTFDPIQVSVRDSANQTLRNVKIIGVLSTEASGLYSGLLLSKPAFDDVFAKPGASLHYVRLEPGVDANATAKAIEKTLLFRGVQADSLRKLIDDYQAQSRGFLYLIQGFMGIGLFVGIAAVGVIAFRTVVERRQQIGMLRAIGYTRRAVAISFLMESSFTALLGIGSGIGLGLLLAYQLVSTDEFVPGGVRGFYIPWMQILAIGGFAFVASFVMTLIPARQASGIPIADALRYE